MIHYELICAKGHGFEGWFRDGKTYDQQAKAGKLTCPVCGTRKVDKAVMAPSVSRGGRRDRAVAVPETPASAPPISMDEAKVRAVEVLSAMRELRRHVEANADYVGDRFAETARQIHYGETEKRNIYGETSDSEAETLQEEGIEFQRIPWVPRGY